VQYVLQMLGLDANKIEPRAEAQQIVVANLDEVRGWLFK
jgi:hypothetical protein